LLFRAPDLSVLDDASLSLNARNNKFLGLKLIFGDQRNVDILAEFLKSVLDIPDDEYDRLTIVDPYVKKESEDDKYGILDVKLHTVSGSVVHVEIQLRVHPDMKARTIYSQAKLVTEQILSGQNWSIIKRVVTIVITEDIFIPEGDRYHHQFR
jgi:predicted transposase/invertase (TIGR01784 family)